MTTSAPLSRRCGQGGVSATLATSCLPTSAQFSVQNSFIKGWEVGVADLSGGAVWRRRSQRRRPAVIDGMCGPVGRVMIETLRGGVPALTAGMAIELAVARPRASSKRPAGNTALPFLPRRPGLRSIGMWRTELALDRRRIGGLAFLGEQSREELLYEMEKVFDVNRPRRRTLSIELSCICIPIIISLFAGQPVTGHGRRPKLTME